MSEKETRYQKWVARIGVEEARRISLERCHRSRIKHGTLSPDGPRKPKTREEKLARRRAWAEKNRGHLRDYAKAHYEKNSGQITKEMTARYKKNPEKWAAGDKARRALKAGKIIKSDRCSSCDRDGVPLEMHHSDYTKPLLVDWLCRRCHRRLHALMKGHVPRGRIVTDEVAKEKQAARRVFHRALKAGTLVRPSVCSKCGSEKMIEGHHLDYARPLEIEWLCRKCHRGLGHTQDRQKAVEAGSTQQVGAPSPDSPG